MKKYFLLFTLAVLISCNNDNDATSDHLKGRWNWIITSGGFGAPSSPESLKQKIEIEFAGSSLKTYTNGNLSREQKFFIQTKKSVYGGNRKMIVIDKGNSVTQEYFIDQSFEIIGKKLYLRQECVDCATSEYERVR